MKLFSGHRKTKHRAHGRLSFGLMALMFRLRDVLRPPSRILEAIGLGPNQTVLDFGCGPGAFSLAAAQIVAPRGKVYAVDINPIALRTVERAARKNRLSRLAAMTPDDVERLAPHTVDVVLMYDVLHEVTAPAEVLAVLHRAMKPEALLTVSDHHLREASILDAVTSGGLFEFLRSISSLGKVYCFKRLSRG